MSVPFMEELTTFKSKLDYALCLLVKDQYSLRFIPESASECGFALLTWCASRRSRPEFVIQVRT